MYNLRSLRQVWRHAVPWITAGLFLIALLFGWGFLTAPDLPKLSTVEQPPVPEAVPEAVDQAFGQPELPDTELTFLTESQAITEISDPPLLKPLVERGALPPAAERTGSEPLVLDPGTSQPRYGGTWFKLSTKAQNASEIKRISGATLVRWSPAGYPIVPHIAKSYSRNENATVWTFELRKGMRWSDGEPFTTRDILFKQREMRELDFADSWYVSTKGRGTVEAQSETEFTITFPSPKPTLLEELARGEEPFVPAHYLEPFFPADGDPERIQEKLVQTGALNPHELYWRLKDHSNPLHPRLSPWIYRTFKPNAPQTYVRNPYYFAVDSSGRQLPYIDRIVVQQSDKRLIPFVASTGDLTFQMRELAFRDYTLLMQNRISAGYQIRHYFPANRSEWVIFPNLTRAVEPDNPATRWKADLLKQADFRKALSLAIHREAIIEAVYGGVGKPEQLHPGAESPFAYAPLANAFTEHDPETAGHLLDSLGLDKRDQDGYRTFPDGTRMTWFLAQTEFTESAVTPFVIEDWKQVGLRVIAHHQTPALFSTRNRALLQDLVVWTGDGEFQPLINPRNYVPDSINSYWALGHAYWYQSENQEQTDDGTNSGPAGIAIPPPDDHPLVEAFSAYETALHAPTLQAQVAAFRPVLEIAAEQLWTINVATPPPVLAVVDETLKNVPEMAIAGWAYQTPANLYPERFFLTEANDSADVIAQMENEILFPQGFTGQENGPSRNLAQRVFQLLPLLGFILIAVFLGVMAIRYTFILQRLLIFIPSLAVVSVVSFMIIEIPPGNFVESKIQELVLQGDQAAVERAQRLREVFHLDESLVTRYAYWLGLPWFVSFEEADRGLLQGNLGLSMETVRPVSEVVGDRFLLTFSISFLTILFTWVFALPVGIACAVRQNSWFDYLFSVIGFIGMCIPNFLLALVLIFAANHWFGLNVTGLFSPEYASQPGWSPGKVIDLFKHIWVPVLVLATSGTAGMIRVMRANLLDELRQPYVTTARAKGVRPVRLLLKYPVRLALNPFVSGIGGIFPSLVSGGAIVAMVMSLPTIGPLLLQATLAEDTLLAGSMLMLLTLLSLIGTLVSDLLLLWLDPRIRVEGGNL